MADIVKLNVYLVAEVDQADVPKLRAIRERYVNTASPPASTLVFVDASRPARLADRDRGESRRSMHETKTAPAKGAVLLSRSGYAAFTARCLNMLRRASSSISALNLKPSLSAIAFAAAGRAEISSTRPLDVGIFRGGLLAEDERDHARPSPTRPCRRWCRCRRPCSGAWQDGR